MHPPGRRKKIWAKFIGEICKGTQAESAPPPRQSKSPIFKEIGGDLGSRRGYLGSFRVCLRATTEKGRKLLGEEKCTPDKILAMPIDCDSHRVDRVHESLAKTAKPAVTA